MKEIQLIEALTISQARKYVKNWDKTKFKSIFQSLPYKKDKNAYRVYIPLENTVSDTVTVPLEIQKFLDDNNFEMLDYIKGIVQHKEKKQPIKLGKVLTKFKEDKLLNLFNTDKTREAKKSDYMIVLSRHPYDIAGMSTDRGWTSCMRLDGGDNKRHVKIDIEAGTIIAYVTDRKDINVNNPTGRILIKPFIDKLGSDNVFFVLESKCYGTDVLGFEEKVEEIVDQINSRLPENLAIFVWNDDLYDDGIDKNEYITGTEKDKQTLQRILKNPELILKLKNPRDELIAAAISKRPDLIEYIDNPSLSVQIAAVRQKAKSLLKIKVPRGRLSEKTVDIKVLKIALVKDPMLIYNIEDPSDELLNYIIEQDISLLRILKPKLSDSVLEKYKNKLIDMFVEQNNFDRFEGRTIINDFADLESLAEKYDLNNLKYYNNIVEEGFYDHMNLDGLDYSDAISDIETHLEKKEGNLFNKLKDIVFGEDLKNDDIDLEEYEEKTLQDLMSEDSEIDDIIKQAIRGGFEAGTVNEISDAVKSWIDDNIVEETTEGIRISIDDNTLFNELIYNIDEDLDLDIDTVLPDFSTDQLSDLDEPSYGFFGYDEGYTLETVVPELEVYITNNEKTNESIDLSRLKKLSGII